MSKRVTTAIHVGTIFLAAVLIGLGFIALRNPASLGACATWGYPERLRDLAAVLEIAGGLLLLWPRFAWYGAIFLGLFFAGAVGTDLWNGPTRLLLPGGVLLAGIVLAGYARHPRALALARLRAVADVVAEREMAQQREQWTAPRTRRQPLTATSARTKPVDRAAVASRSVSRNSAR